MNEQGKEEKKEVTNTQPTPNDIEPNIAAVFSYLLPIIGGLVFFTTHKNNKFVKFHAAQSIGFWVLCWLTSNVLAISLPFFLYKISLSILSLGGFGLWLMLMYKAYSNQEYQLPYLGKIVKEQLDKYTSSNAGH